jgi:hypothetical protein
MNDKPKTPGITPAAITPPEGFGFGGPQPAPDPWTVTGSWLSYYGGLTLGNPTGGFHGNGTINASAYYINGTLVNPSLYLKLGGGTMTGPLILNADPANALGAATKNYVDAQVATVPVGTTFIGPSPPASPIPGQMWWDEVGGQLYVWYNDGTSSQWVVAVNAINAIATLLNVGTAATTTALNITTPTVIKATAGRVATVSLLGPGSLTLNDASSIGAASQSNILINLNTTTGQVFSVDLPVNNGIVVSSVSIQSAVSYQ